MAGIIITNPITKIFFRRKSLAAVALVAFFVHCAADTVAQVDDSSLRAGWILALIQYTNWKERNAEKITICTIGRDAVGVALRQIKKEKSLPIVVEEKSSEASLQNCHVAYIAESDKEQIDNILKNANGSSILTVSTIRGFAIMGGIVEFITTGKKVSLLINVPAAKKAHIVIGGDLLAISKHIN